MNGTASQTRNHVMAGLISPVLEKMVRSKSFAIPADLGDSSRILVVDSGDLTELLFFSPVLNVLKTRYPGMRVTFLVREGNSELVRGMNQVSEMISYECEHFTLASTTYISLVKRIRRKDFTAVILLGREFNFARSLLALLSHARIRIGFTQEFTYPYINCELRQFPESQYEGDKSLTYLTGLGIHQEERPVRWSPTEQDIKWARQLIHFRKPEKGKMLVAVDPGKGKGNHRLVDESFAFLVQNLNLQYPCKIMVLSNNLDAKEAAAFKALVKKDVIDLEPKNVKEGLALLSCADLLLSGNTDYFHFGVSIGVPTIGLFTRHDTGNWIPKGTSWVQIIQGIKGQQLSLDEFFSK
ncbi:MAG: glycosyltransferase family 9 protein, partial [Chitinivibrionia bacterium]|nr:glycosyltransferase family 9 protein [Chitinivibrionia bacterium]